MVEAVLLSRGAGGNYDARLVVSMAFGYSVLFLRSVVYISCDELEELADALKAIDEVGVWGGLVVVVGQPCEAEGVRRVERVEDAVLLSEVLEKPLVIQSDELVDLKPRRLPTFNRNWGKGLRWVHGVDTSRIPNGPLLKLYACLWRKLKYRYDVPIVVVDYDLAYVRPVRLPDWLPTPTAYEPQGAWDLVDISVRNLSSVGIALGLAQASYDLGPVIVVTREDVKPLLGARMCSRCSTHVVRIGDEGLDPCEGIDEAFRRGYAEVSIRGVDGVRPALDYDFCDRCGDCIALGCPAIGVGKGGIPRILDGCTGCGACVEVCSRGAIRLP